MEVYDELEDDGVDLYSLDDESNSFFGQAEEGTVDLINQDYNLDSPLNPTFMDMLLNSLKNGTTPSYFRTKIAMEKRNIIEILKNDEIGMMSIDRGFHRKFVEDFRRKVTVPSIGGFSILSDLVIADVVSSAKLVLSEVFRSNLSPNQEIKIKEELNNVLKMRSKTQDNNELLKWLMMDSIIKLRNFYKTNKSIDGANCKLFNNLNDLHGGVSFSIGDGFYRGLIFSETYYIRDWKILVSHNELLMAKDVYFSRWINGLIMRLNLEGKYSEELSRSWTRVVIEGDSLIESIGNKAYNSLKMLEPMCSHRWLKIAEDEEFMDLSNSLDNHLKNAIKNEISENPQAEIFFKTLSDELNRTRNPDDISIFFGSFRIWGHPYIYVEEGLRSLKELVRRDVIVDEKYAEALASDLAKKCLQEHFKKTGRWGIDKTKLKKNHILIEHIKNDVWPTNDVINQVPDRWHLLPLSKIYDVPTDISLSTLYADKSHSDDREELYEKYVRDKHNPIPSRKVLQTLLESNPEPPNEFLKKISENGLDIKKLIIGLREKEREMKIKGRFFTLMSWELREYIVLTEYLIKKFFLPLFSGITMADGLTTVLKKMIKLTSGQSGESRDLISIANHIDYEKWNNLQRGASVSPVFKVMDQLMGFEGPVIARTHEFFEKTLVYFAGRPDKLMLKRDGDGNVVCDEEGNSFAWNGQKGGFEGLRQKGWTVCGALLVERESRRNNVKVNLLAQGDNQIIVTNFRRQKGSTSAADYRRTIQINNMILERVLTGAERLGLSINRDETMSSSRFFIYGKIPIFRGNFLNLEGKKWSRATCVSNDQLPTSSNIMGAVSTTFIGSMQFEEGITQSFILYNIVGTLCLVQSLTNNPIINKRIITEREITTQSVLIWLYLDKSVGGFTGMSPSRALIRQFPDPITESLSFWRKMKDHKMFNDIAVLSYSPKFSNRLNYESLIESPTGLNIVSGSSIENSIKKEVRKALVTSREKIKNRYIRSALEYDASGREPLISFLLSVEPCFPRFLSEFKESTEVGLSENIIGLIQNSRTIRNVFKRKFSASIKNAVKRGEEFSLKSWREMSNKRAQSYGILRVCSAKRADELRNGSWRREIIGATVPHPLDYLDYSDRPQEGDKSVLCGAVPNMSPKPRMDCGPLSPYLGSKTSETTSVINHWEREVKNPLSIKAFNLLRSLNWFVREESNLGRTIIDNAKTMSKTDLTRISNYSGKRTGTAVHRFSSSRVSNGGFIPTSPNIPRWMFVTAEGLGTIREKNYDFMYQATMLYAQSVFSWSIAESRSLVGNFRWSCLDCLREVEDITLESPYEFDFNKTCREFGVVTLIRPMSLVRNSDSSRLIDRRIDSVNVENQDYHIGMNIGIVYALQIIIGENEEQDASLFSNTIKNKIKPKEFMEGFIDGIRLASVIVVLRRYRKMGRMDPVGIIKGTTSYLIQQLRENIHAMTMFDSSRLRKYLIKMSGFVPPSFPTSVSDLQNLLIKSYHNINNERNWSKTTEKADKYIYSDTCKSTVLTIMSIAPTLLRIIMQRKPNMSLINKKIQISKSIFNDVCDGVCDVEQVRALRTSENLLVNSEIRHSLSERSEDLDRDVVWSEWGSESRPELYKCKFFLSNYPFSLKEGVKIIKKENPIIAGLRINMLPTGAHYKIRSISKIIYEKEPDIILSIGDGSGGCGSALMRIFKRSNFLHNSLYISPTNTNGVSPQLPSGYSILPREDQRRLLNGDDYWKFPSDLSKKETWDYFLSIVTKMNATIGVFCDAEVTDDKIQRRIDEGMKEFSRALKVKVLWVVWKVYDDRLMRGSFPIHIKLFGDNQICKSIVTSAYSFESYMVSKSYIGWTNEDLYMSQGTAENILRSISTSMSSSVLFKRCQKLMSDRSLHKGIPIELKKDPILTLFDYLYEIGLPSKSLNKLLLESKSEDNEKLLGSLLQDMMKSTLNEESIVPSLKKGLLIPKYSKVMEFGSFVASVLLLKGLIEGSEATFKEGEELINEGLSIRFKYINFNKGVKISYGISSLRVDGNLYYSGRMMKDHSAVMIRILETLRREKGNEVLSDMLSNCCSIISEMFETKKIRIGRCASSQRYSDQEMEKIDLNQELDMEGEL